MIRSQDNQKDTYTRNLTKMSMHELSSEVRRNTESYNYSNNEIYKEYKDLAEAEILRR